MKYLVKILFCIYIFTYFESFAQDKLHQFFIDNPNEKKHKIFIDSIHSYYKQGKISLKTYNELTTKNYKFVPIYTFEWEKILDKGLYTTGKYDSLSLEQKNNILNYIDTSSYKYHRSEISFLVFRNNEYMGQAFFYANSLDNSYKRFIKKQKPSFLRLKNKMNRLNILPRKKMRKKIGFSKNIRLLIRETDNFFKVDFTLGYLFMSRDSRCYILKSDFFYQNANEWDYVDENTYIYIRDK